MSGLGRGMKSEGEKDVASGGLNLLSGFAPLRIGPSEAAPFAITSDLDGRVVNEGECSESYSALFRGIEFDILTGVSQFCLPAPRPSVPLCLSTYLPILCCALLR